MNKNEQHACKHTGCCNSRTGKCGGFHAGNSMPDFTAEETAFLRLLSQAPFLPIGQFLLKSSRSDHLESVALAPVYLTDKRDSMESIHMNIKALKNLEQYGVITLDYDIPLENYDYTVFEESEAYRYFQDTVTESRNNPDFIFDTAALEFGSLALTGLGQDVLDALETLANLLNR
jgi:hypothetical protein